MTAEARESCLVNGGGESVRCSVDEALRYMGAARAGADTRRLVERAAAEAEARARPRWVWREAPLSRTASGCALERLGVVLEGRTAAGMLAECHSAALLACTLGQAFERWVQAASARDMAWAVALDACGSALVEAACDAAEAEIRGRHPGTWLTDRFSPGYGDLPLTVQPSLLAALDAERRLGVTVTDSCLLLPQKTVTAVIGMADRPQRARVRGCAWCALSDSCAVRKEGGGCDA